MASDQFFSQVEIKLKDLVSTPYGMAYVIEFMDRYASLGAQQTTPHIKVKTISGSVHWFELVMVDLHWNRI
jgi:hypothetical protein